MRVAVVFIARNKRDKLLEISKALAAGIESQGHRVEIIDGMRDVSSKLTIYEYIAVGTEVTTTFGGKIPEKAQEFLKNAGVLTGKRCFAFVIKSTFGGAKGLQRLMKAMEGEGMYLRFSEVLTSALEAQEIGKRLSIH